MSIWTGRDASTAKPAKATIPPARTSAETLPAIPPPPTAAEDVSEQRTGVPGPRPPLPLDGRPRRPWREHVRARAATLSALAEAMREQAGGPADAARFDEAIRGRLATADDAARGISVLPAARRARMERAYIHLDDAEVLLYQRAPDDFLRGRLPALLAHVTAHLPPRHPQRLGIEKLAGATQSLTLDATTRGVLVSALDAASRGARREHSRLRSFRTIVVLTTVALFLLAAGLAAVSGANPQWMPLCFAPQGAHTVVCPTTTAATGGSADDPATTAEVAAVVGRTVQGQDALVVMMIGLAAAAVTGAAALRLMRGSSTPYAVPVALLLLKLPTGALTAFFGLILLQGEFVPGLSALDTSGQILAWALLFGAAQQLVTGLVDKKAQSVLDSVGPAPMTADRE